MEKPEQQIPEENFSSTKQITKLSSKQQQPKQQKPKKKAEERHSSIITNAINEMHTKRNMQIETRNT